jgi:hypothetical protein
MSWRMGSMVTASLLVAPRLILGQCTEPHYRWTEKTDETLANTSAVGTSITTMLNGWAPLELTRAAKYKCWDRTGRELKVYSITGWVRRVKTGEDDGDWHIELTRSKTSPVGSCIVVEIPPADLNGNYAQARLDLDTRVNWSSSNGDVSPPVKLRFIGAAFFDGQHRGANLETSTGHGRCNSSVRALWELHPVYWVKDP